MLACFLALLFLMRWITKHVQGIGYLLTGDGQIALVLYFLLILPGVALHELSHALTAWILRVRVRRLSIGLQRKGRGQQIALWNENGTEVKCADATDWYAGVNV